MYAGNLRDYIISAVNNQLTENSIQSNQPSHILTQLRPHQLTLLHAARALETNASITQITLNSPQLLTQYGVIADRVGSGKSLVVLALIGDPPINQTNITYTEGSIASRVIGLEQMSSIQPTLMNSASDAEFIAQMGLQNDTKFYTHTSLIIVPHTIIQQWEQYVNEHTTMAPTTLFIRKTKNCNSVRSVFTSNLVIISSTMIKKFKTALYNHGIRFSNIVWSRVFIDEADSISCALQHGELLYRFIWFITGSWLTMLFPNGIYSHAIINESAEIKTILGNSGINGISRTNIIGQTVSRSRHTRFTSTILRNADEWTNKSLLIPKIIHETILCTIPTNIHMLRGFISSTAMEALHAGDLAGALVVLGLKTTSSASLVDRVTGSLRGDLVQAEKLLEFKQTMEYSTQIAKTHAIDKATAKVLRIRAQLEELTTRIHTFNNDESFLCPICFDPPRTRTLTPCCNQSFCLACLCESLVSQPRQKCPLCRTEIVSMKDLIVVDTLKTNTNTYTHIMSESDHKSSGFLTKDATLIRLLSESTPDQRFLIFSAHEASFRGLCELVSSFGIRCELLSGSSTRIERLRNQFSDGTVRVLCLNTRHVGAGINLESATHVVLYHKMNAEMERQVIGRAIRFDRSNELKVIHLVHDDESGHTIEHI